MGAAIPCSKTILREITSKKRVNEGEFQFDAVKKHLEEWNSPPYVHIQLDDTRVIPKIEYDPQTNRFIGFCLSIHDWIPVCDAFVLNTFEEIKNTVENNAATKYAHCIIVQPIDGVSPSTLLFVLGTDSKYNHEIICKRLDYIKVELLKREINVISFGADGAGPFMKAMLCETFLFKKNYMDLNWTFLEVPMKMSGLYNQYTISQTKEQVTNIIEPNCNWE